MYQKAFPVIDPVATGANIVRLRIQRGLSVRDLQAYFGFEEPQAIYKWQKGKSLRIRHQKKSRRAGKTKPCRTEGAEAPCLLMPSAFLQQDFHKTCIPAGYVEFHGL